MTSHLKASILVIIYFSLFPSYSFSQTITADTTLANKYFDLAQKYEIKMKTDTAIFYAEKAKALYIIYPGEKSIKNANVLHLLGRLCFRNNKYDLALEYNFKALQIRKEILGEKHIDVARSYNNIGLVYGIRGEYDKALKYHFKALQIRREILGEKHPDVAQSYNNIGEGYFKKGEYNNALENYFKVLQIRREILGEKHPDVAASYNNIGIVYDEKREYDKSLEYYLKASFIYKEIFGENNTYVAQVYNNIGIVYDEKREYDKSLEYYLKASFIYKEIFGENNTYVAQVYNDIGFVYSGKGEYDKALGYHFKALQIEKEIFGENNTYVAQVYNNIGIVYDEKGEYDKALEYYFRSLQIRKEILGEKHIDVAQNYNNIGAVYWYKGEYEKALKYFSDALQIRKAILGEKHPSVAEGYNNIGGVYARTGEYDKALEYFSDALQIRKEILGENHPDVATSYNNIGEVYKFKGDYNKALDYQFKALQIEKEIFGEKHPDVAGSYINIGVIYNFKGEYDKALEYCQKGAASCLYDFKDTIDVYKTPTIKGYLNWKYLLQSLQTKARIIADKNKMITGLADNDRKKIALRHYQACDTLIDLTRKEISTQSDKLALGEQASQVYKEAVDLLTFLQPDGNMGIVKNMSDKDRNLAFYFSEKNKSSVLLEALAGQEAQKYAGIPDSLLQKEHNLKTDIAFYAKKLAEPEKSDSDRITLYQDRLFHRNLSNDSLIKVFEKQFPEYHNLKYNIKSATVKDIQKILDRKTAMISYFVGDSTITSFTLTRSNLYVQKVPEITNLNDSIVWFRYGLTKTSLRMQEIYRRLGYKLYHMLLPENVLTDSKIENLIIIPDGELAIIPFESLLTENYTGDLNAYKEYPYLIKKYNISYTYSANLFYLTFSREPTSTIEITKLNDWLAFAPVFDNSSEQNLIISSQELQRKLSVLKTDSAMINRSMFNLNYITPLPATETETESIFKLFDNNNLKAKVLLHNDANEHFIKSGELEKYKVLHFATHGFINSERPELSGLLLAQDTTGGEDGVLYSGEIYNLKLNADLVVLSACETGLGKIQKGEGIIGLTRALLYAGAKNIIVSLWEVADESTSDLMVDFYKNTLAGKGQLSYSEALRNAKLKMINEGRYAHPLFWSPFILIGK